MAGPPYCEDIDDALAECAAQLGLAVGGTNPNAVLNSSSLPTDTIATTTWQAQGRRIALALLGAGLDPDVPTGVALEVLQDLERRLLAGVLFRQRTDRQDLRDASAALLGGEHGVLMWLADVTSRTQRGLRIREALRAGGALEGTETYTHPEARSYWDDCPPDVYHLPEAPTPVGTLEPPIAMSEGLVETGY